MTKEEFLELVDELRARGATSVAADGFRVEFPPVEASVWTPTIGYAEPSREPGFDNAGASHAPWLSDPKVVYGSSG